MIEKRELIRKKITDQVLTERHILAQLSHPLISKLYYAFSTESHLFLVMEYFSGGDLASVIKKIKRLSVDAAQFYAAQLVLAVEHMHKNSFVHRDIKPDNILLDDVGHLKLSDFGVAAVLDSSGQANGKEGRIIGTPNYIPPEVVSSKGEKWTQTTAFDIWSLGIVLFEFLVGIPPLNASQTGEIFSKIVNFTHIDWTNYSDVDIPVSAINLIDKLLRLDPSARLDFAGIKSHEFFKTIDWENIESKRAPEEVLWAMKDMKESIDLNEKRLKEDEEDLIAFCKALGTTIGDDVRGQPNNIINDLKDSRICGPSDLSSRRTGVSSRTIDAVDVSDDEYAQHGFLNHFKGFEYVNLKLLREINNASC